MNFEIKIGIFGGSGFYDLLDDPWEVEVDTPYGKTSDKIMVGELAGKQVAFLPRHGKEHKFPPHKVPCKANLHALKSLGVEYIISPVTTGSLQANIAPGDFVIVDDFFDRTKQRDDTFYHGPKVAHFAFDKPYCEEMRKLAIEACKDAAAESAKKNSEVVWKVHKRGTIVVIEGPRFSSKAESKFFTRQGFSLVNMTHYPEVVLARELGLCYCSIALVTDWDVGLEGEEGVRPVTYQEILKVSRQNIENVKNVIKRMVGEMDVEKKRVCYCARAEEDAVWS